MIASALISASSTTSTTTAPAGSGAVANDRGVIHQLFSELGSSQSAAHTAQIYLAGPLRVIIILVVAFVLTRLVTRLAHRLIHGLRLVSPLIRGTPRGADRVRTLAGASASVFRAVIWVVAALAILGEFHINLAPFIATATVIGAAIGFGAQSLVKDFLSGVLILAEDQYGVGDHIVIGTGSSATSGTVESVNLRVTRLRALDGGILYVPNGDIRIVGNDTETDSQAIVDVVVPPGTDLVAAGAAAEDAARLMAAEEGWADVFVGHPIFAGVQGVDSTGVTLRVLALTRPGQHFRVARELRLRVIERLRRDRLAWVPEPAAIDAAASASAGDAPADHDGAPGPAGADDTRDGDGHPGAGNAGDSDAGGGGTANGGKRRRAIRPAPPVPVGEAPPDDERDQAARPGRGGTSAAEARVERAAARIRKRVAKRPDPDPPESR